jgi:hypothetical protein
MSETSPWNANAARHLVSRKLFTHCTAVCTEHEIAIGEKRLLQSVAAYSKSPAGAGMPGRSCG